VNQLLAGGPLEARALVREWLAAEEEPEPLIVETSGSTGVPKRVLLSRKAVLASADATRERLGGPGQWLLALPATYVAGLQVIVRSLRAGYEPVLAEDDFVAAAATMTGPRRYVSLVPTQLARMLRDKNAEDALRGFDAVLLGGARVPESLRGRAAAQGIRTVATYGMAETCGGCVYDGMPLDGVAVKIDRGGRILIAGPVLFDGYEDRALTATVLDGGWFATADHGRLDEDGRLEVLGRIDDVIITGGVNVPAQAVAELLAGRDGIAAAEVVGVPDPEWGERVVAVVVPASGQTPDLESLREAFDNRAWAPKALVVVDAMPMLANGKVDRTAVKELAAHA
jgi:O-succinylbenzoic acid--CoA ligase